MLTASDLRAGFAAIAHALPAHKDRLNAHDAELGDGDLGSTLESIAGVLKIAAPTLPDDIGAALASVVRAIAGVSGSSFSGVVMAGLARASARARGKEQIGFDELVDLVQTGVSAMSERGGAKLGDKSVLDGLDAVLRAWRMADPAGNLADAACAAVAGAIESFRMKPSRIGRARLAGDRSIGLDDPGMLALQAVLDALANNHPAVQAN